MAARWAARIRRDKTFLFGYYEGFRNRQGETQLTTVPTAAERQGNFSAECSSYSPQGFCADPNGTQLVNVFASPPQPLPFNQLPPGAISSISQNLLAFYPLPNEPNYGPNAYGATQELQNTSDQFGLRLDHYISSRDTLSFHYLFTNGSQLDPLSIAGANVPGFPVGENFRAQNAALEETHSFSPSVVNVAPVFLPAEQISVRRGYEPHPALLAGIPVFPHATQAKRDLLSSKSGDTLPSAIPSPDRQTTIRTPFL